MINLFRFAPLRQQVMPPPEGKLRDGGQRVRRLEPRPRRRRRRPVLPVLLLVLLLELMLVLLLVLLVLLLVLRWRPSAAAAA